MHDLLSRPSKPLHPDLFYGDKKIIEVAQHTHLGVALCNNLSWRAHVLKIYVKASKGLNILKRYQAQSWKDCFKKIVQIFGASSNWIRWCIMGCTESESDLLEHVEYKAAKIVTGAMKGTSKHRLMQ